MRFVPPRQRRRIRRVCGPARRRPSCCLAAGRLLTIHFYSHALHRVTDYLVYLPVDYSRARRLPVFYMLHGMPGRPLAFTVNAQVESKLEQLIRRRRVGPMILVFPDGRIGGDTQTDSEWANTSSGQFESYVVDVVHNVDSRFATLPYRQDRVVAGLSSGAYGALNVGLHRVTLFGLIQVWSGYFVQTRSGVFSHATKAWLEYNSPLDYVRTMKHTFPAYPLRVFLYVGNHDGDASPVAPDGRGASRRREPTSTPPSIPVGTTGISGRPDWIRCWSWPAVTLRPRSHPPPRREPAAGAERSHRG